jgi:hypothetical protein
MDDWGNLYEGVAIMEKHSEKLLVFIMAALFATHARSQNVIFDTLSDPGAGYSISAAQAGGNYIANSFSTGSSPDPVYLSDVKFDLYTPGPNLGGPGNTTANLYSDGGSSGPGSFLDLIGSVNNSLLTTSYQVFDFSSLNIALAPGTRYWIEWNSNPTASANLAFTPNADYGVGANTEYWSWGAGRSLDSAVSSTSSFQVTVVPEPSAMAMAGLGGLGILFMRRCK